MKRNSLLVFALVLGLFAYLPAGRAATQPWATVGPYGGDARSFACSPSNPSRVLLGTTSGWIYQSSDGGPWTRLSRLPGTDSDSLVVDHILFDESNPKRLVAGAWRMSGTDGGVFISDDDGHRWKAVPDMKGKSVRALAQAPSDPKVFVAGTLKGVYRSQDGGLTWTLISPPGSMEIHEIESIAIDPVNPKVIYAGTWHLPWKTENGGKTWHSIKKGILFDSDVFSIIIDPHAPETVYASACSGIYKSNNGGRLFHKIEDVPLSAERTRVMKQDPSRPEVVYAGTTAGLYRTMDAGARWRLMTPDYLIINDIYVDPRNPQRILLATDRSGVLESDDGAVSFHPANRGFSQRQVSAMITDPRNPGTIYAGVVNGKRFGGVFVSKDSGKTWSQIDRGLDDRDVFSLAISPSGVLLAGTNQGIYRLHDGTFEEAGHRLKAKTGKVAHRGRNGRRYFTTRTVWVPGGTIDGAVRGLAHADGEWYAATSSGVYTSTDSGFVWRGGAIHGADSFRGIVARGDTVLANGGAELYLSTDQGKTWRSVPLPAGWDRVRRVAMDGNGEIWAAGRLGVAYSADRGQNWKTCDLPLNNISSLAYDAALNRIVVSSYDSDVVLGIDPIAKNWIWWNPGWRTRAVGSSDGRLVAATLWHGIVVQPGNRQLAAGTM